MTLRIIGLLPSRVFLLKFWNNDALSISKKLINYFCDVIFFPNQIWTVCPKDLRYRIYCLCDYKYISLLPRLIVLSRLVASAYRF